MTTRRANGETAVDRLLERLYTPATLSERLGIPVKSLYRWHSQGKGPRVCKLGRHLRYRPADVERWLEEQAR
jgi:excisionase family DNA binding protein